MLRLYLQQPALWDHPLQHPGIPVPGELPPRPLSNWKVNQPPAHLQLSSRGLQLTRSPVPAEEKHLCNIMVPPLCFTIWRECVPSKKIFLSLHI
ncbi:hypothetical protein UPYG_G00141940 [Umbra pygmaea]|uniref:Uncharacterized protein n=1 Tax=Umbra pygmaea TaxID=75934 RepID=A0ABD0WVS2_UMBPY